jgi:thioredoxin 1
MKPLFYTLCTTLLFLSGCESAQTKSSHPAFAQTKAQIGQGKPLMLEVGADYCTACQKMAAMIDRLKTDNPGVSIYPVNVNKEREAAMELDVRMIPTQIFYDGAGREVYRHIGGYGEAEFRAVLKTYGILKE